MDLVSSLETGDHGAQVANPTNFGGTFREAIFNFKIKTSVCKYLIVIMVVRQWESVGSLFGFTGVYFKSVFRFAESRTEELLGSDS